MKRFVLVTGSDHLSDSGRDTTSEAENSADVLTLLGRAGVWFDASRRWNLCVGHISGAQPRHRPLHSMPPAARAQIPGLQSALQRHGSLAPVAKSKQRRKRLRETAGMKSSLKIAKSAGRCHSGSIGRKMEAMEASAAIAHFTWATHTSRAPTAQAAVVPAHCQRMHLLPHSQWLA